MKYLYSLLAMLAVFPSVLMADDVPSAVVEAVAPAAAQTAQDGMSQTIMLIGLFVLFYFLMIRPQTKRAKTHQDLLSKLQEGDEVVTIGGIMGRVKRIVDQNVTLTIASNVDIQIQKTGIAQALPKGTLG